MNQFVAIFGHNDYVIAAATFLALVVSVVTIYFWLKPLVGYVQVAITVSFKAAERRRSFRRALLAHRCADEPSYYIADTLRDFSFRLLLALAMGDLLAMAMMAVNDLGSAATWVDHGFVFLATMFLAVTILNGISRTIFLSTVVARIVHHRRVASGARSLIWGKRRHR